MWESLILVLIILALYIIIVLVMILKNKQARKDLRAYIRISKGVKKHVLLNDITAKRASGYFRMHKNENSIDDITWEDLNLDDVYSTMNNTYSAAGEEILYNMLRNPSLDASELEDREKYIQFFSKEEDVRVDLQETLTSLGYAGRYSIYDYLEFLNDLKGMDVSKDIVLNFSYLLGIGLLFTMPSAGIVFLLVIVIYQFTTYYNKNSILEAYMGCFSYVIRSVESATAIAKIKNLDKIASKELENIEAAKNKLKRFSKGTIWIKQSTKQVGSSNPLDPILDIIRMATHVDIIKFSKLIKYLNINLDAVWALMENIGKLDATASIASYRFEKEGKYCIPTLLNAKAKEIEIQIEDATYPLLEEAVPNSIYSSKSILITGSNASGKSTFLRTVAINAVLAQSIHTCMAKSYQAPLYRIFSSISISDDLLGGDSYYMAEIKAMKRILDSIDDDKAPILCFVDEVLRGTNTLERVAAASQILQFIGQKNATCFAATHDLELCDLLTNSFENYHFCEEMSTGDIVFTYILHEGKATTRNAIRLLEALGYSENIIKKANDMAANFLQTGKWM